MMQICYNTPMNLGNRIKTLRTQKRINQSKLSELTGLERSTLIRIENGEVDPRISTLKRIAKALEVDVKEFL
jgi:transcriptional regulator with XRE-family HTH domain